MKRWLFASPSADDIVHLLKAWRFWLLATILGGLLGAGYYVVFPPEYRAQSTIVLDFNLEQSFPDASEDLEVFYYLERESRKVKEVAWSDAVMQAVADEVGNVTVAELRGGMLLLSQPSEGGWHFWAESTDPQFAASLSSTWAKIFTKQVRRGAAASVELNGFRTYLESCNCTADAETQAHIAELEANALSVSAYLEVTETQTADIPVHRKLDMGIYVLAGAILFLTASAFIVLFIGPRNLGDES